MRSGNGLQVLKVDSEVVAPAQGDGELAVSLMGLWFLGSMLLRFEPSSGVEYMEETLSPLS